jgi:hypothetical protein
VFIAVLGRGLLGGEHAVLGEKHVGPVVEVDVAVEVSGLNILLVEHS